VNAALVQKGKPTGAAIFPELETCANCNLKENKRVGLTGTVLTIKQTSLYLIPIQENFSINPDLASWKVPISSGVSFEIAYTYDLVDGHSRASSYGLLANTYGSKYLGVLLLSSNSTTTTVDYVKKNIRLSPVVTYIAGAQDLYPNKVENILLALKHLSSYQDLHQGFGAHKYISVLRAFGFYSYENFQEYKYGALASGASAPAGGVCAAATGLASLAYLTKGAKIVDIVHHDEEHLYFQGPFSPPARDVDSGISIRPDGSFEELGFMFPNSGYISVEMRLFPSGVAYDQTDQEGLKGPSDVLLVLSISISRNPIPEQGEFIANQLAAFQQYRQSAHVMPLMGTRKAYAEIIENPFVTISNVQKLYNALNKDFMDPKCCSTRALPRQDIIDSTHYGYTF
jgi:hypothetical protein